jgi:hypothetical protein
MQPHLSVTVDWGSLATDVRQAPSLIPPVFPGSLFLSPLSLLSPLSPLSSLRSLSLLSPLPSFYLSISLLSILLSILTPAKGDPIVVFGLLSRSLTPADESVTLKLASPDGATYDVAVSLLGSPTSSSVIGVISASAAIRLVIILLF